MDETVYDESHKEEEGFVSHANCSTFVMINVEMVMEKSWNSEPHDPW